MPHHVNHELEGALIEARAALIRAKSRWSRVATEVLKRTATPADVDAALAELRSAFDTVDLLNKRTAQEEDA